MKVIIMQIIEGLTLKIPNALPSPATSSLHEIWGKLCKACCAYIVVHKIYVTNI